MILSENRFPLFGIMRVQPSPARLAGAVGARDQAQHAVAVVAVDHGGEETAGGVVRAGAEFAEGAVDALGLQGRQA